MRKILMALMLGALLIPGLVAQGGAIIKGKTSAPAQAKEVQFTIQAGNTFIQSALLDKQAYPVVKGVLSMNLAPGNYQILLQASGFKDIDGVLSVDFQGANVLLAITVGKTIIAQSSFKGGQTGALSFNMETASLNLSITANVAKATVSINGKNMGSVGQNFILPPGTYTIKVSAPGFQDYVATVNLAGNQTINASLVPLSYNLTVTANVANAEVWIENKKLGQAGQTIVLPPGSYNLRVSAPGYVDYQALIKMEGNQNISVALSAVNYKLTVSANVTNAEVWIENKKLGQAGQGIMLPPGNYNLRVSAPGYLDYQALIKMEGNQNISVSLLPQNYKLTVNANVANADVWVDNKKLGQAGQTLLLPPGTYTIRVSAQGYIDSVASIQVQADQVINLALLPLTGTLKLNVGKIPFQVSVDGVRQKGTPDTLELSAGTHQISLEFQGLSAQVSVQIEANKILVLTPFLGLNAQ